MRTTIAMLALLLIGAQRCRAADAPLTPEDCGQEFLTRAHATPGSVLEAAPGCTSLHLPDEYEVLSSERGMADIYENGLPLATIAAPRENIAPPLAPVTAAPVPPKVHVTVRDRRPCHLADNIQYQRRWRDAGAEFVEIACRPETRSTDPALAGGGQP